jgi:hypothetical protein
LAILLVEGVEVMMDSGSGRDAGAVWDINAGIAAKPHILADWRALIVVPGYCQQDKRQCRTMPDRATQAAALLDDRTPGLA